MGGTDPMATIDRLVDTTNAHDPDGIANCFAVDYRNETPAHPSRSFTGREQVRRNWTAILDGVPDLTARIRASVVQEDEVWSEWAMSGTRRDGAPHRMAGAIVFRVHEGLIVDARFYLEPVDEDGGSVDVAVGRVLAGER